MLYLKKNMKNCISNRFVTCALCTLFLLGLGRTVQADVVVAFGDSITAGFGATPYSTYLQQTISTVQLGVSVVNEGRNGESTTYGLERIDSVLNAHHPTYILIMEGANDVIWGTSPSTTWFNLERMIQKSQASGAIPLISTITPDNRPDSRSNPETYNPGIFNLAQNNNVAVVDTYSNVVANWSNLSYDGLHPNNEGARLIANGFFNALPYGGSGSSAGSGSGGGGGGGGCFIATAAFGTAMEPQVVLLKQFRDKFLLTNSPGTLFVRMYYKYSPPIAHFIARHDFLRFIVRLLLYPLIGFAQLAITAGRMTRMVLLGTFAFSFIFVCFSTVRYFAMRRKV